jgi:acetyl-CoA C-acetyltransferase
MAWQGPDYKKDVIPVRRNSRAVLVHDDGMRADTSMEKLRSLPRLFDPLQYGDAIAMILNHEDGLERFECLHSAGNAPLMADAASLMLLGNRRLGTRLGIKPVARFINFASVSVDPVRMLHGVVDATKLVLKKSKLKLSDVDLFEVNESFAAIPLMYQKRLGVRADQLNISGGAIALGHPLGATGGILIGTLIHNLRRQDKKRGIATICGGAGIAQATLLEVL